MQSPLRVGVLGAGLGSRLQSRSKSKPLAPFGKSNLLQHLLDSLKKIGAAEITCALRDELLDAEDKENLPQVPGLRYIFVNTESSLHTLGALIEVMGEGEGPTLFTMADTILRPRDLADFASFLKSLAPGECAVLATTFVDDEKPLWIQVNANGYAEKFGADRGQCITSGIYVLSPQAMKIALENIVQGKQKMRNFLADLAERKIPVKTFVVSKTIDVDHPSDLDKAEEFLRSE